MKKLSRENRWLLLFGGLSLVPVIFSFWPAEVGPSERGATSGVDTVIPAGFVLVPIELQNYEALDSILGQFGRIDLFAVHTDGRRVQKAVGRNVKILRAPQNPSRFAVLIPEDKTSSLLAHGGLFYAVLKPTSQAGTEIETENDAEKKMKKRTKIIYDEK